MDDNTSEKIKEIRTLSEHFLGLHLASLVQPPNPSLPDRLDGAFSLHTHRSTPDLYGMIDAVYILYTLGSLQKKTDRASRSRWAQRILECQDDEGWFSRANFRGHLPEHATAYAIGALRLLEVEEEEEYVSGVKPLKFLKSVMKDYVSFQRWIERLGLSMTFMGIRDKRVGWHHVWRGSHIGGGIAAIIDMTIDSPALRQLQSVSPEDWFEWYFDWLDTHINQETGYWQRAFWNKLYKRPTIIDMGGAVHFYWIYMTRNRSLPYPKQTIETTIALQQPSGLYKDHPFCIDLDGNFCVIRPFLQLPEGDRLSIQESVEKSIYRNFDAVINALTARPMQETYSDLHGLPGALASLIEAKKLPNFAHNDYLLDWQHPLDKVCWL